MNARDSGELAHWRLEPRQPWTSRTGSGRHDHLRRRVAIVLEYGSCTRQALPYLCGTVLPAALPQEASRLSNPDAGQPARGAPARAIGSNLDFLSVAQGMGVPATRAATAEELVVQLEHALREPGPHLVEAVLPTGLG